LTTAAPGAISHLDNGTFNITFPSVSGYVEISNVFTCTGENELDINETRLANEVYIYEIIKNGEAIKKDKFVVAK
ncbi:MAG: hypothetical protein IT233_13965, partial [Bacteroidia bacterium]|nr:hypothetical protein [Bacteroidia bacterium]